MTRFMRREHDSDGNGWRLVVAIADVGYYIRAGSALDSEASARGNSVYFPTRVVPMLPAELSNGICSLNPHEDRYCMVCDLQINADGTTRDYRFYPAIMHSKARLTYEQVNEIITAKKSNNKLAPHLNNLHALSQSTIKTTPPTRHH